MPELPEVETIKRDLQRKVLNRTFLNVWTDSEKIIKQSLPVFKKNIKGSKIKQVERQGKNLIFTLSNNYFLFIHLKLTGYLLFGEKEVLENKYLRVIFYLDKEKILALSDLRKFAKIELAKEKNLDLGPDPLKISFAEFKKTLPQKGKIKNILLNQKILSGIGNIYACEILFKAKIHPFEDIENINKKTLYNAIRHILNKGIKYRGASVSDYKDLAGEKGSFDQKTKVYAKEGKPCLICKNKIKRIKKNNRSTYFCPYCQKKL